MTLRLLMLSALFATTSVVTAGEPFITWSEWTPTDIPADYFSIQTEPDGAVSVWFDAAYGVNGPEADSIFGWTGPSVVSVKRTPPRFDNLLVTGYEAHKPRRGPILSRTQCTVNEDGCFVVTGIGPEYKGGSTELVPVLFYSATGTAGDWEYLGPPPGDPAAMIEAFRAEKQKIRSEGGTLLKLPDGRWRLYLQCFRIGVAILEADSFRGPWSLVRGADGNPLDAVKGLPGRQWLFPAVIPLGGKGFLLTGADQWPPREIWAAHSSDGLTFTVPGGKPVITRDSVGDGVPGMKCLRGYYDAERGVLVAALSVWVGDHYVLWAGEGRITLPPVDSEM